MAIIKDKEGYEVLKKVVGRRLKMSRKAAGVTEADAAEALGHKGITQVSLAESGERVPPLLDLMKYADLYCVPIDFLLGRIDDQIAEPEEHGQALIARSVSATISEVIHKFTAAVSEHSAVCIAGHREDRIDLRQVGEAMADALTAYNRVRELNPEFDEDWRGTARLASAMHRVASLASKVNVRIERERRQREVIDTALGLEKMESSITQFQLEFQR
jgi:transcriptional regulator with XRE-family HTH domain